MRIYEAINKKKHGGELTDREICEFVCEYTDGKIPDYQASALLMAIAIRGMTERETFVLTDAISHSGDTIDLSPLGERTADKHSTGGVGDKTTLVAAPIAASLGCIIAKMSGRGLGHTGGTVDKLESIPGYKTALSAEEFFRAVQKTGIAVAGQSGNLAPADKKLYALRDVTATVDSVPLIASSVMGKKLAAGAKSIVLDVKYGTGSFMKSAEEAESLASVMVALGKRAGRKISAIISNMDVPLGRAVGNSLEVIEAINTLKGEGPEDLTELSLELASEMASLALGGGRDEMKALARESISSGAAFQKFKEWITAQGGDAAYADNTALFKTAKYFRTVTAECDGYISSMDTEKIGLAALELGAGRRLKEDEIDHAAGIILSKKTRDKVKSGEEIATLYSDSESKIEGAVCLLRSGLAFSKNEPPKAKLIYKNVR